MAILTNIFCVVLIFNNVPKSFGLIEGTRGGASWSIGGDIGGSGRINGDLGGNIKNDIDAIAHQAEHLGGDIANAAGELVEDVGKGVGQIVGDVEKGVGNIVGDVGKGVDHIVGDVENGLGHIVGDIGGGIEAGAKGIMGGAEGAIDGIGGIVGKLNPPKHNKKGSSHEKHHDKKNKHHAKSDESEEDSSSEEDSFERKHHKKHEKKDSREHHGSHEKHHQKKDDKRGHKHHNKHTGRGIDGKTGIGSHDGIRTPILDLLGLTKSICTVSYAAEGVIEDLGELHMWADKQMGLIEHAAVNYIIDNFVLKAVDGARKYHNKIVDFIIDTHIGIQTLVTNSIIEVYRVTKAPIRELFACH